MVIKMLQCLYRQLYCVRLCQISKSRTADKVFLLQVPCHFVPQLQMEMLASGAPSALVVSRSATKVSLQHHRIPPLPNAASSCYKSSEPATRVVSQHCCHGTKSKVQTCTAELQDALHVHAPKLKHFEAERQQQQYSLKQ